MYLRDKVYVFANSNYGFFIFSETKRINSLRDIFAFDFNFFCREKN